MKTKELYSFAALITFVKKNIFSIVRILLIFSSLCVIIILSIDVKNGNMKGGLFMAIPQKVDFTDISTCQFLKCEDTCYGPICYCILEAWGDKTLCPREVKEVCEKEHYIVM